MSRIETESITGIRPQYCSISDPATILVVSDTVLSPSKNPGAGHEEWKRTESPGAVRSVGG